jgi:hypothetical protein
MPEGGRADKAAVILLGFNPRGTRLPVACKFNRRIGLPCQAEMVAQQDGAMISVLRQVGTARFVSELSDLKQLLRA